MRQAEVSTRMYDSLGRVYDVTYEIVDFKKSKNKILTSNMPHVFLDTPGYPREFQARSLERRSEIEKIKKMAKELDPYRLILPHADPTMGAPVVWFPDGEEIGYILGGNGRTLAIIMSEEKEYKSYEKKVKEIWGKIWPQKRRGNGVRRVLVRRVKGLDREGAIRLSGATQASSSGRETPLGEALSLVRSLGLDPKTIARRMPTFSWNECIARDNVDRFIRSQETRNWMLWLKNLLGETAWSGWMGDISNATKIIQSMFIGFLPKSIIVEGFHSDREEKAVLAALPFFAQISTEVERGELPRSWDLIEHIEDAQTFLHQVRNKSFKETMSEIERMARQEALKLIDPKGEEIQTLARRLTEKSILLALILKRGENSRDPSIPVEDTLRRYLTTSKNTPGLRQRIFSSVPCSDTDDALGRALAESIYGAGSPPIRVITYASKRENNLLVG